MFSSLLRQLECGSDGVAQAQHSIREGIPGGGAEEDRRLNTAAIPGGERMWKYCASGCVGSARGTMSAHCTGLFLMMCSHSG